MNARDRHSPWIAALWLLLAGHAAATETRLPTDWGEIRFTDTGLLLDVTARPDAGTIAIPRLNNVVAAVHLAGDKDKAPLKLSPGVKEWTIALPGGADSPGKLAIVVETIGAPYLPSEPRVAEPAADGTLTLAAHDAVTHGEMLRFEPQPHKNTVGYWSRADDWCQWHFSLARGGRYEVQVLQGCGQGQGGSEVAVVVGGREILFTVEETGHFQNFKRRTLGVVELDAAPTHTLELRPRAKAAAAVMDVRQVRLVPLP